MALTQKSKSPRELKEFGYIMALALLIITAILLWKNNFAWIAPFSIATVLLVFAIFLPLTLAKPEAIWMKFGLALGFIMTHVLLTVFFFIIITPLSLLLRLCGKKFMMTDLEPEAETYWIKTNCEGGHRHFLPY